VLEQVRKNNPTAFGRMIASLVPARIDVAPVGTDFDNMSDEELIEDALRRSVDLMDGLGIKGAADAIRRHLSGGSADRAAKRQARRPAP
jgi:hypothetical protein